jgi:hypothetical protein
MNYRILLALCFVYINAQAMEEQDSEKNMPSHQEMKEKRATKKMLKREKRKREKMMQNSDNNDEQGKMHTPLQEKPTMNPQKPGKPNRNRPHDQMRAKRRLTYFRDRPDQM